MRGIISIAQIDTAKLEDVIVIADSEAYRMSKSTIKTQVLDVKSIKQLPVDVSQMLNNISGVRMRQSGGLGATYTLLLNGFQGQSIRYFKDGVPTDYLGSIFSLSSIPLNAIQRVEIYRGMLPAHLGADVLGGAVNIVTQENTPHSFLDISSDLGSFNTYRFSLNGKWLNASKKLYTGVSSFYNHSDNNYQVKVPVTDPVTANIKMEKLPLFNNQFTNYYTEFYTGWQHQKWADDLRLSLIYFNIARNYNYGSTMDRAYGAVHSNMHSVAPTLRYQKRFWNRKGKIDQFLAYSQLKMSLTDTLKGRYDWRGNFQSIPSRGGEASANGSLLNLNYQNFISRTNVSAFVSPQSKIVFNSVFNHIQKVGSDPFGHKFPISEKDVLSEKTRYQKWALALGWDTELPQYNLSNQLLIKYFNLKTDGIDIYAVGTTEERVSQNSHRWGIAEAIKYRFHKDFFTRFSAEWTSRLPNQEEFFGDGAFILPNLKLQPEKSWNINWDWHYERPRKWKTELNIFYRYTEDMIRLINTGFFNVYKNIENVKGYGIEWDNSYQPFDFMRLNGNITYQEFRLFGQEDATYRGSRIPNTPYFFANLGVDFQKRNVLRNGDQLKIYWLYNYVKTFYIAYVPKDLEPDGFLGLWGKPKVNIDELSIPDQNLHSTGITWIPNDTWSFGLGVRNVFDSDIFDNFRIQNAGRSFHIKINYSLKIN